jgi:hypothetical protein
MRDPTTSRLARASAVTTFALACVLSACRTREDAARNAGREAAHVAASSCDADAGDVESCRARICRDRCAPYTDSKLLTEACMGKCTGEGTCDSDSDCSGGNVCMMIAPRLRRCQPRPDAHW